MGLTRSKRTSIVGLPIGKKHTTPDWGGIGRLALSLGSGTFAAVRARQRLKGPLERGKEMAREGKEALGKATQLGDMASSVSNAASHAGNPVTKAFAAVKAVSANGEQGDDGGEGDGGGHDKRLSTYIEEHIDVAVPRREAYNQWTQFAEFSEIFKGVVGVEQEQGADDKTRWQVKIGPSSRQWKAQITEQIPDRRIAWKSTDGVQVSGVVTFHELDAELTRVMVQMLYRPHGVVENVGNWLRLARRRTRKELKLFKNYIEVRGEASGEWRGRIKDEQGRGEEALRASDTGSASEEGSGDEGGGADSGRPRGRSTARRTSGSQDRSANGRSRSSGGRRTSASASGSGRGRTTSKRSRTSAGGGR